MELHRPPSPSDSEPRSSTSTITQKKTYAGHSSEPLSAPAPNSGPTLTLQPVYIEQWHHTNLAVRILPWRKFIPRWLTNSRLSRYLHPTLFRIKNRFCVLLNWTVHVDGQSHSRRCVQQVNHQHPPFHPFPTLCPFWSALNFKGPRSQISPRKYAILERRTTSCEI